MNYNDIKNLVEPFLKNCDRKSAQYLSKFFKHPSAYALYDSIDNELFLRNTNKEKVKTLLISSCIEKEGRTTTAITLAALTAAMDPEKKILLVDADFNNADLSRIIDLNAERAGLQEYFVNNEVFDNCVHPTVLSNLFFTPNCKKQHSTTRLHQNKFQNFVDTADENFDLIIVDSSAGNKNRCVISLAKILVNTLLIIKYNGASRQQIGKFVDDLVQVNTCILGSIISQRKLEIPRFLYGPGK